MIQLSAKDRQWAEETWQRAEQKLRRVAKKIGAQFPYTTIDGDYEKAARSYDIAMWTNGFWPCMMLQGYLATGEEFYLDIARGCEQQLDEALHNYDQLIHDVGFMWDISAFADYRLTGSDAARQRGLLAAAVLASRFNLKGGYIRAWNMPEAKGWAIIDCMMNLPLLYRASEAVDDERFAHIARAHADMAMKYFVRPDGSCEHVIDLDPLTGVPVGKPHTQGYSVDSSWSRGQAWGLYGFVLSHRLSGEQAYLDTAKRIAHYFLAALSEDGVPDADFRAPSQPVRKDSTAGVCAACGLLEIARCVGKGESKLYVDGALKILKGITQHCCDFSEREDAIVGMGTEAYHQEKGVHIPIIYGDSFYLEALQKLLGNEFLFW